MMSQITFAVDSIGPNLAAALWFTVAILVMDRFDISLPRGDSIGVSGALVVAGMVVAGASYMWPLACGALILSQVGYIRGELPRLLTSLMSRATAILVAAYAINWWGVAPGFDANSVFQLAVTALLFLIMEVISSQVVLAIRSDRPLYRLLLGNLRRQAPLIGAQISAAILAVITYPQMGAWSLVLVVALLLLMRQSLASLLEIRETYRATVEVLVEAAEGQNYRLKGHAERSAQIAREIGSRLGLSTVDLERASYTALLHGIDALSEPWESETSEHASSSSVFEGTTFFDDVLPALRLCDGCAVHEDLSDRNLVIAMVAALSNDIDAERETGQVDYTLKESAVSRVFGVVPLPLRDQVISAALELGYKIPHH